jgi:hypothetical protein
LKSARVCFSGGSALIIEVLSFGKVYEPKTDEHAIRHVPFKRKANFLGKHVAVFVFRIEGGKQVPGFGPLTF